ncbi:MAG TPA: DUF4112 domain-containing protein [Xanthobacteraceae bacterium]|nr:DUF4112 domain-containing protein [Xanthobacteraceae bacterium]
MATTGFAGRMTGSYTDRRATLARLRSLATLLDTAVRLPGGIRVGADSIIGLAPGIGDAITTAFAAYIVFEAHRLGLPKHKIMRMIANVAIDGVVGAVPVVGDLFDVAFRANMRNLAIIEKHFADRV